jgi:hypothetical protein
MQADGLTREHVASHLQKYRMHKKEHNQEEAHNDELAQAGNGIRGDGLDGMLRDLGNVILKAMLEGSGMAKQAHPISGADGLTCAKQLDAWRGLANSDISSNSVPSVLPPDCQSLETPSYENRMHLPGPGIQVGSTAILDGNHGVGERTDRTGDQSFDDIFDFLTLP